MLMMRPPRSSSDFAELHAHYPFVPINPLGRYGGKKQFGRKSAGTPLCGAAAAYIGHDPRSLRQTRIPSDRDGPNRQRSEEHTSELQSLMRISYAVFCLKKKKKNRL